MRLLFGLTYYRPHISGLTIATQRLAEGLAARGHEVTVLTSQNMAVSNDDEWLGGVRIVRVPTPFRISKGVIMPGYARFLRPLVSSCDAAVLNLPCTPIESVLFPLMCMWFRRPAIASLHCDVRLPKGWFNRLVDGVVFTSDLISGTMVEAIVANSRDYARFSPLMRCFPKKARAISPPIDITPPTPDEVTEFRSIHAPDGEILIGMPCRFSSEKGVEVLLEALPEICRCIPNAKVVFVGEYKNVVGEEEYIARLMPVIKALGFSRWEFLGVVEPPKMSAFYTACSVIVLPSLNRTESFGLVQVESMLCGTPVVAADLPGVRVPVGVTGMGKIVPPGDSKELAKAIIDIIERPGEFERPF
ncbi:MAG: glycosyltransferase family 4 protein, partial [Candidatus Riflebacteria bacterium]|nr:glycosyltransferase family 4 protein [Candidatus Riflebacteria bacterium]